MRRIYNIERINYYLSQPDILPQFFLADKRVKHPDVYCVEGAAGLYVCFKLGFSMECHAAIPKENRGKKALNDAKRLIKWVFQNTPCTRVYTKADKTKKHLMIFNALLLNRYKEDDKYVYYEVTK